MSLIIVDCQMGWT